MNRRDFIFKSGIASLALGFSPLDLFANTSAENFHKLTILHTNDTHSRILPFPKGTKYEGMGGVAQRAALINKIRSEEKNVLLLDSGDIFQGTPFFNEYEGELELKLMSEMGYDATTLGNHDFDAGVEGLAKQLPHANFPFLNVNYTFDGTALDGKIKKYKIFRKENLKIGVFGVGIELEGLVPEKLCTGVMHNDPIAHSNLIAAKLKNDMHCDFVICLSHLGLEYFSDKVSDVVLAKNSKNIDLILGGHTHTFLEKPMVLENLEKERVIINQVGWAGIILGRLDLYFKKNLNKKAEKNTTVFFSEKTIVK